jgi:hypothetical protein
MLDLHEAARTAVDEADWQRLRGVVRGEADRQAAAHTYDNTHQRERNEAIDRKYACGWTIGGLAKEYGISPTRVRSIIHREATRAQ